MADPAQADYIGLAIATLPATISAIAALVASVINAVNSRATREKLTRQNDDIKKIETSTNGMQAALLKSARVEARALGHTEGVQAEQDTYRRRKDDAPHTDHTSERKHKPSLPTR